MGLNKKMVVIRKFKNKFPGTIINIEIDQNDTNFYKYHETVTDENLF